MQYFNGLSETTQNLVMLNFEFFGKKLLIGIALIFSLYYLFFYWKEKKESIYLLTGIIRIMLYICSWTFIIAFPLLIFFLYPQINLDQILIFMLITYSVGFFVASSIVILNIFYFGTGIIISFANIKRDPKIEKVKKKTLIELVKIMGFKWKND